jgi:polar amino acid transport system permease protein
MQQLVYYFFNWAALRDSLPFLFSGLIVTVELSAISMVFVLALGLLVAVLRHLNYRPVNWLLVCYVDVFRAMPPLVLLLLVYFALPFVGLELTPFPAAVLSFALYRSAYTAEIFRSGIEAVPVGQGDAARSLGMSYLKTMWYVVLPQAFRIAIPPLTSEVIGLVKLTSLAFVIALPELLRQARTAQTLTANPTPLMAAAVIYFLLLQVMTRTASFVELRLRRALPQAR